MSCALACARLRLVVLAAVSAGAELLADGNIHVYGPLRGRALAGVEWDPAGTVRRRKVMAEADRPVEIELRRSEQNNPGSCKTVDSGRRFAKRASMRFMIAASAIAALAPLKCLRASPEHRDVVLTKAERERAGLMCICVSRAQSERLVLDL